jgi:sulfur carrier protein ThiS
MSPDGATNKYWAQSGAKLGDDIEIITVRASFNGTPQGENAWFVELVSPGTRAFYTVDTATVDFASTGGEQDIEVFAYNTDATVTATSDNEAFAVSVNGNVVTVTAAANELEEVVTGNITIKVGDLEETVVKATLAAKPAAGEEAEKTYTLKFGPSYNSKGQSSYSNSWYATCDGFIWDIVNANNNNNGWSYVKMGSKNAAYVGEITTRTAMQETIKTVTMTVDAVTASKINSIKLYVANNNSFTNAEVISVTPAKGDLTFNIQNPTANCYYKIKVDCQKATSNGPIQISKVVYTNK